MLGILFAVFVDEIICIAFQFRQRFQRKSRWQAQGGGGARIRRCYSESIYTRVQSHYSYNYKSGLQLNTKGRQILKDKVALYAFPIKKEYYKTKEEGLFAKCILPIVEKMLDNRLKPKAGSTRT